MCVCAGRGGGIWSDGFFFYCLFFFCLLGEHFKNVVTPLVKHVRLHLIDPQEIMKASTSHHCFSCRFDPSPLPSPLSPPPLPPLPTRWSFHQASSKWTKSWQLWRIKSTLIRLKWITTPCSAHERNPVCSARDDDTYVVSFWQFLSFVDSRKQMSLSLVLSRSCILNIAFVVTIYIPCTLADWEPPFELQTHHFCSLQAIFLLH